MYPVKANPTAARAPILAPAKNPTGPPNADPITAPVSGYFITFSLKENNF